MKNLLVTGYRAHELQIFNQKHALIKYIQKAIENRLRPLLDEGLEWMITPGQYGVDLWAVEVGIALKAEYPNFRISIMTAYANPDEKWKEDKQEYYQKLLRGVDYFASVSKEPYSGGWQLRARDDLLFRKTDGILMFYDEEVAEGSPKFYKERAVKKQMNEDYRIIGISSEEIQNIAEEENLRYID
ncbi:DUF1273 domain-containing protein [Paenibacillus guangzhouensis]|uniref:DUF1273 domain-containing protein n=1 Tax=Paenibacillus guangzhouensis TaxID=1473112 RepID=UPI001266D454|nr:DUF1273 domain-containing protein [Paenibacillus guangzhouensis]